MSLLYFMTEMIIYVGLGPVVCIKDYETDRISKANF